MIAGLRRVRPATVLAAAALVTLTAFNTGLTQAAGWVRQSRASILTVAGLGFLAAATWDGLGRAMGLAAIGVAFLIVERLAE